MGVAWIDDFNVLTHMTLYHDMMPILSSIFALIEKPLSKNKNTKLQKKNETFFVQKPKLLLLKKRDISTAKTQNTHIFIWKVRNSHFKNQIYEGK